jgi:hypothetical protein
MLVSMRTTLLPQISLIRLFFMAAKKEMRCKNTSPKAASLPRNFGIAPVLFVAITCSLMLFSCKAATHKYTDEGTIQDIQAKGGVYPISTVTTTTGIFQVEGSVSAAIGDHATLQITDWHNYFKEDNATHLLCIDSKVKPHCYRLK